MGIVWLRLKNLPQQLLCFLQTSGVLVLAGKLNGLLTI